MTTAAEHLESAEQLVISAAVHAAMGRHKQARTAAAMAVPHFVAYGALRAAEVVDAAKASAVADVPYSTAMNLIGKARVGELHHDAGTGAAFVEDRGVKIHVTEEADTLAAAGLIRLGLGGWRATSRGVEALNRGEI